MTSKKTTGAFLLIYLVIVFFYISKVINPELYYHLHQPAFLPLWFFMKGYLSYPGGPAEYISTFLEQFLYNNLTGAFLIILLGLIAIILSNLILNKINCSSYNFFLSFLSFIALIALLHNYYFPFSTIIKTQFTFFAVFIFQYFVSNKSLKWVNLFVLSILVHYFSGSGYFIIYMVCITIICLRLFEFGKNYLFVLAAIIFGAVFPYVVYRFLYPIAPENMYLSFLPNLLKYMKFKLNLLFYFYCFSVPILSIVTILLSQINSDKIKIPLEALKLKRYKPVNIILNKATNYQSRHLGFAGILITFSFISIITYFVFKLVRDDHKKNIIAADYYCYKQDWNKVISIAQADKEYNYYINFSYNRAIDNTNHYVDMFFKYPQLFGSDILYPDRIVAGEITLISSDYYFDLGYISEAQRWAYEALVDFPYSPRVLKRLIITHLINGNYEAAKKYLYLLDKNFFYKDFVRHYMPFTNDTLLAANDSLIREKRNSSPGYNQDPSNFENRFKLLLKTNGKNIKAYEHLQMLYLLDHSFSRFVNNLSYAVENGMRHPLYNEAVLIISKRTKSKISNYEYDQNTVQTFHEMINILKICKDKKIAQPALDAYSGTYFYYLLYNSPLVTHFYRGVKTKNDLE